MTRNVIACGLLSCFCLLINVFAIQEAVAQDSVLADLYGRGVHAYFRADYPQAQKLLETVVQEGTTDPRVYYFLGLSNYAMGDDKAYQEDFTKGAQLELSGSSAYPVGKSLERVQGDARLELERYRDKIRTEMFLKKKEQERARFEALQRQEEHILRGRPATDTKVPVDVPQSDATDPYGSQDAAATPATPPAKMAPATEPDSNTDPFGSSTPMPTAPATEDPFGGSSAPMPANPSAPVDPFGTAPEPADPSPPNDPFGNVPGPANPGDPFMQPVPSETPSVDPFGSAPEPANPGDPFMQPVPSDTPAADPFGGAAPAAPQPNTEPSDDPFGAAPAPSMTTPSDDPFGAPATAPAMGPSDGKPNPVTAAFSALGNALIPSVKVPSVPVPGMGGSSGMPQPDEAMPSDDPFGAPPANSDPFGTKPPANNQPYGVPSAPPTNMGGAANDPFGGPSPSKTQPSDDPFGAPPANDDPFGAPSKPMTPPSDDPFGAAPAGDDPFGATPPAMTEPKDDPFGGSDPFGN